MRTLLCFGLLALSATAFAQSGETPPKFEAADIHLTGETTFRPMNGPYIRATRFELRNATMVDLIRTAYGVEADFVYGGPSWMGSVHFDVVAKVPPKTSWETARLMLRNLLIDRFNLKTHPDKKPVTLFVLSAGKGKPKLKPSAGGEPGCRNPNVKEGAPPPPPPPPGEIFYLQVTCQNLTAGDIVTYLRQMAAGYLTRTVIDTTNLEGKWDFDLKWTDRNSLPNAGADGISIFDAVDKQLGLKLELQTPTLEVIAIDSVNDKPTDNLPDIAKAIPEAPKEFEVASIKPSPPDSPPGTRIRFQTGGRVDAEASLKSLIVFALNIPPNLADDLLVGGPDFLDTARYTIVAKAPLIGGPTESFPPLSDLQAMLRSLIIDQFNLVTHTESRDTKIFALTAPKSETKLKRADSSARGNCVLDVASGKAIGTPGAYLCQNTTMAELAKLLQERANAYTVHPVVDLTGITGGWDFSIGWTPLVQLRPENAAGMTLFEAVEKMLGLKLEEQKRAIPVTVIDRVDPKPKQ